MRSKRTEVREVEGMSFVMGKHGFPVPVMRKLVFRITKDEWGKSISLCDEKMGVMLEIPLEPVEDLL